MNPIDLAAWLALIAAVAGPLMLIAILREAISAFHDRDDQ